MSHNIERLGEEPQRHSVRLELAGPAAAEVDAGTAIRLRVKVSCEHGCDLRGRVISVVAPDGAIVAQSDLVDFGHRVNETADFAFKAPDEVGDHSWTVVFAEREADHLHRESAVPITVCTIPHDTSLAVWGVPSPIVTNHPFRVHVGATCSAGCNLSGREIQVCDDIGASIARAHLGETPWEGTRALYWTEVDLVAPSDEGTTSRSIAFAPSELRLPHGHASARFGFETVKPPQHVVTVRIVQKGASTPVEDAQVRLGVYLAYSDGSGVARVALPQGTYELDVLKTGYETSSRALQVTSDIAVEVEIVPLPPVNYDDYWIFDPTKRT